MLIPLLCASSGHLDKLKGYQLNYYIGDGVLTPLDAKPDEEYKEVINSDARIRMIHMIVPDDIRNYYTDNLSYLDFVEKLNHVGITLHYKGVRLEADRDILFNEILRIHDRAPNATIYMENEGMEFYSLLQFIKLLRDINIDAWMLLDTCHIEAVASSRAIRDPERCVVNYKAMFEHFKDYIGAYHLSASRGADGFALETHGKPIKSDKDEVFFNSLCKEVTSIEYDHDVYIIPEVTEDVYGGLCTRKNGLYAYSVLQQYL